MLDVNLADQTAAPTPSVPLSDRDREILAFERQWWKYAGSKEQAIKELFDMSSTRYYQVLNALIDRPDDLVVRTALLCLVLPAVVVGPDGRGMHDKLADTVEIRM